jgi:hypothetical protein
LKKTPSLPHLHKAKERGNTNLKNKIEPRKVLRNKGAKVIKLGKDQGSTKKYFRRHRTIELGEALKSNNITKRNVKE